MGRQGRIPIPVHEAEKFTITQAILMAGGFSQFANTKKVKVIRKEGDAFYGAYRKREYIVNVKKIMKGDIKEDMILKEGDVIIVKEKWINIF